MDDDNNYRERKYYKYVNTGGAGGLGFAYFLGMIGAAVYYVQEATSFWGGVIGLLKALVWPAYLVYHLLQLH